jgi:hypothetical protein
MYDVDERRTYAYNLSRGIANDLAFLVKPSGNLGYKRPSSAIDDAPRSSAETTRVRVPDFCSLQLKANLGFVARGTDLPRWPDHRYKLWSSDSAMTTRLRIGGPLRVTAISRGIGEGYICMIASG